MAKKSKKRAAMAGPAEKPVVVDSETVDTDAPESAATTSTSPRRSGASRRRRSAAAASEKVVFTWPFGRQNLIWLGIALVVIVLGYVFLAQGPYDSASSLTIGPFLLVIGYLVLLPVAILVRDKSVLGERKK